MKTLGNREAADLAVFGDGDTFKLICKSSSQQGGWIKSTRAMQVGSQVVIQVSTQQRNPDGSYTVAEALQTVMGTIKEDLDDAGKVVGRHIESQN